jgi:hypothetical protein
MGRAARDYVTLHFNRETQAVHFRQMLHEVGTRRAA